MTSELSPLQVWLHAIRPKTLFASVSPILVGSAVAWREDGFHLLAALVSLSGAAAPDPLEPRQRLLRLPEGRGQGARRAAAGDAGRTGLRAADAGGDRDHHRPRDRRRALPRRSRRLADLHPRPARGDLRGRLHGRAVSAWLLRARRPLRLHLLRAGRRGRLGLRPDRRADLAGDPRLDADRCLATAIIVANNLRDIETDRAAGKHTLATRLGREGTVYEYTTLIVTAFTLPILIAFLGGADLDLAGDRRSACRSRFRWWPRSTGDRPGADSRPGRHLPAHIHLRRRLRHGDHPVTHEPASGAIKPDSADRRDVWPDRPPLRPDEPGDDRSAGRALAQEGGPGGAGAGDRRALDVATGTGDLAIALADGGFREVIGLDFAPEMIAAAEEKRPGRC